MTTTDIMTKGYEVLSPLLLAAVTWVAAKLAQFTAARVRSEYVRGVLVRLDDAVIAVVREVQQVTVDEIKAASSDGKLPAEARERAKRAAITTVKSYIGPKGLAQLTKVLGIEPTQVDQIISTRVEAAVHDLKVSRALSGVDRGADPLPFGP